MRYGPFLYPMNDDFKRNKKVNCFRVAENLLRSENVVEKAIGRKR